MEVAQHVLWHKGDTNLGLQPGSFVTRLLQAIEVADSHNLARMSEGFPEYVAAMSAVRVEPWGLEWLRSMAKRALVPDDGLDLVEGAL